LGFNSRPPSSWAFPADADSASEIWANGDSVESFTYTLSHELAETLTDVGGGGFEVNPGSLYQGTTDNQGQIGDYEGPSYAYRMNNGVVVQPYWSMADGAWLGPDGTGSVDNKQQFLVNPIWKETSITVPGPLGPVTVVVRNFTNTYSLAINGDQGVTNNNLTLRKNDAGLLEVDLNGAVQQIELGTMVPDANGFEKFQKGTLKQISINLGGGNNTINLQYTPTDTTTVVNDDGADTVTMTSGVGGWVIVKDAGGSTINVTGDKRFPNSATDNGGVQIYGTTGTKVVVGDGTVSGILTDVYVTSSAGPVSLTIDASLEQLGVAVNVGPHSWFVPSDSTSIRGVTNLTPRGDIVYEGNLVSPTIKLAAPTLNVLATGTQPTKINFSDAGPYTAHSVIVGNAGSLQGILGTVNIEGPPTLVDITVDDSADTTARTATLSVLGANPADSQGNSNVWGQISGLTASAPINYEYGDTSSVTVKVNPASGVNTLILDDRANSTGTLYVVTDSTVQAGKRPQITYSGFQKLEVKGSASSLYGVLSTSASTPVTLTGAGSDTVRVGNSGNLSGIQGALTVNGTYPGTDLNIDDSQGASDTNIELTRTRLTGLSRGQINFDAFGLNSLTVRGVAPGDHTYTITNTPFTPGGTTLYTGGSGNEITVYVRAISGPLNINPQGYINRVTVGSTANDLYSILDPVTVSGGIDQMTINDQRRTDPEHYTITNAGLLRSYVGDILFHSGTFTLNCGSGGGSVAVQGNPTAQLSASVVINTGGGNDTISVGTLGNTLAGIGFVSLDGQGGTNTLTINDQGDQTGQTLILGNNGLGYRVEGGGASIWYANIGTLTVNGGQVNNTFTVDGTPKGTNLIVNTQKGTNAVDVTPSSQNMKQFIGGDVTVNSTGTATTVTLNNKADPVPEHYEMGLYKVFLPDPLTINFSNVAKLVLNGGVPDTYTVTGVAAGTTVVINPAAGPNTFTVDPAGVQGTLIIGGTGGGAAVIDDSGNAADATYTVTGSTVQRNGLGSITFTGAQSLTLKGGSGTNTFNVQGTTAATPVTLLGGPGTDIFNVGSSTNLLSTIQGPLLLDGQGGSNFVNFNDQGSTAVTAYTIKATQLERTGGIPIPFAPSSHVYLYASAADDTFDLQSNAIIHIGAGDRTVSIPRVPAGVTGIYDAGVGHDTFNVGNAANTLNEIRGGLGIFGLPGYLSTLNVNDQGSPGNFGYAFFQPTSQTAAILERSDATDINFDQVGQVVLNTGRGGLANVVSVAAIKAGTSVTVNLAGNDFANVGPYGKLDGIQGPLTLHGQGNDSVYLYDNANVFSGSPPVYTITANSVGRPGIAGITYDGLKALTLNTGSAAAPANPWSFINVSSTAAGTATTVNAGSSYQVQVGGGVGRLDGVLGPVTVNGLGYDALNIVDNGGSTGYVYTLSYDALSGRSRVARAGYSAIDFAGISFAAQILAGSGDDTFNIEGKDPACYLSIWGGGGNNTFNVSPTAQNLDGVRGAIAIQGTGPGTTGGSATLTINDQADPIDRGWRLTRGGVALTTVVGISYQDVNQVTVNAGGGNNSFNVEGLTSTTPVTINAGTSTTAVNVGGIGNTLDPLAGSLIVHGAGVTTVNFNNQGANPGVSHGDVWTANHVDFSYTNHPQNLQVDFTGVAQMILSDPGATTNGHVFYAMPAVGQLTINGAGNDILQAVAPAVGQNDWWITGHNAGNLNNVVNFNNVYFLETAYSGTDVFHLLGNASETAIGNPGSGATPVLDLSGYTPGAVVKLPGPTAWGSVGTDTGFNGIKRIIGTAGSDTLVGPDYVTTWVLSGTNAGRVVGAAYYAQVFVADVAFTSFENLRGGSAADTFAFQSGGGVSGRIDGGGGTNTLDYSAYVGDIVVDLAKGTANGTGGVARIANVTGSQGNDILVGDANPNVLRGGTGRNLIIGGGGPDQLYGGGGDNIQIAGTTAYDQDLTALAALMKEFTRTDLNFHQRVDHLMNGTGLNGSYVLNTDPTLGPVTVFDDGVADVLNAGGGLDWFFVHKKRDIIVNQKPGDKITQV
jgi:hypothetical protein